VNYIDITPNYIDEMMCIIIIPLNYSIFFVHCYL